MWSSLATKKPDSTEEFRVFGTAESVTGGQRNWLGKAIWNSENEAWRVTEGGGAIDIKIMYFAPLEPENIGDRPEQTDGMATDLPS